MARRKIVVDGKEYRYVVGKTHTKIDGLKVLINEKIGFCTDAEKKQYAVRPSDLEREIKKLVS